MPMSKKDYSAIASIISRELCLDMLYETDGMRDARLNAVERIMSDLSDYFASDNPLFNWERFEHACMDDFRKELNRDQ